DVGDESVLVLVDVDAADPLDRLLHCRHFSLRSRGQGPWVGLSVMVGLAVWAGFPRLMRRFPVGFPIYIGFSRASPKLLQSSQHAHLWLHIQHLRVLRHVTAPDQPPWPPKRGTGQPCRTNRRPLTTPQSLPDQRQSRRSPPSCREPKTAWCWE